MELHNEDIGTKKDLVLYRIQTAKDNLRSAKILLKAEEYKNANLTCILCDFSRYQCSTCSKWNGI